MTAKQQFIDQVLGGLKERSAYFTRDSIQAAAEAAGLALKRPTLAAKRSRDETEVGRLEAEIDEHVFRLYGLTPEEIALVRGASA